MTKLTKALMIIWAVLVFLSLGYIEYLPLVWKIIHIIFLILNGSVVVAFVMMLRDEWKVTKLKNKLDKRFDDADKHLEEVHNGM